MEKDLVIADAKFKQFREKIESTQYIIKSRRTALRFIGIFSIAAISFGASYLVPLDYYLNSTSI